MCLILFAYHCHPDYPLVLAANRDEYYQRRTRAAHWWPESPDLLAGKDLEADGTWMGVTRKGRLAAVTNVREPQLTAPAPCSRGLLPRRYLEEGIDEQRFSNLLQETHDQYAGYNLLYGNLNALYYYSNRIPAPVELQPGLYGLSNARLDTPWPKVQHGKERLQALLSRPRLESEDLLDILDSKTIFADSQLPATGVSLELERQLSAIRITGTHYGTRSSTALLISRLGHVTFHEKQHAPQPGLESRYTFYLQN